MHIDEEALEQALAAESFSGVVSVDVGDERRMTRCVGLAHRALGVPVREDTRFGIASGGKSFTAVAVMRLVGDGMLRLDQPVRELLGDDLPLVDDRVTVEHLLTHTSGIGDYLDEGADWAVDDYVLTAPVHTLTTAEAFVPMLGGHAQAFEPGERFSYCNGGYVVLALVMERVTGEAYQAVVRRTVFEPAGLTGTDFLRLDELPASAAVGYVYNEGDRANTLHLPVIGNGDGGAFTTAADLHRFWRALRAGRIVPSEVAADMLRPRNRVESEPLSYGMGFWMDATGAASVMEGYDAGQSFRSVHLAATDTTVSVLGNSSEGAWPVVRVAMDAVRAELARG